MAGARNIEMRLVPQRIVWSHRQEGVLSNPHKNAALMETLGREGWELVAVSNRVMYFKRPLVEDSNVGE